MSIAPRRSAEPSYRLLAQTLREDILGNRFAEDEPLPTELALARQHGLSRQTVRRAYLELVTEGLIYRVPGRGTFVTSRRSRYRRCFGTVDDLLNLTLDTELEVVSPLAGTYDEEVAERLRVTSRSLYSIAFRRLHRGEVFCVTRVYLPQRIGEFLATVPGLVQVGHRNRTTIIGLIESRGVSILEAEQNITAVAARDEVADLLDVPDGSPLLHIERLYYDAAGQPVEYAVSDFLPEHYSHRLLLGRGASLSTIRHRASRETGHSPDDSVPPSSQTPTS